MKNTYPTLLFLLMTGFGLASCDNEKEPQKACPCEESGQTVTLNMERGTMVFYDKTNQWGISIHEPNTIDAINLYLVEDLDIEFQHSGTEVDFSGSAIKSSLTSEVGGTEIYCLTISKINKVKE